MRTALKMKPSDELTDEFFAGMLENVGDRDASAVLSVYFSSHRYHLGLEHLQSLFSFYDP
jgi:hypothetical protein